MTRTLLVLFLSLFSCWAQQAGVTPEWEARKDIPALPEKVRKLLPLLQQLQPHEWVVKGASETYVDLWKSVQTEVGHLESTVDRLAQSPDRLPIAMEVYFRMISIETRMGSLVEAIRKYQNPALADLLQSIVSENLTVRSGLQQYILEVANQRDAEWKVMEDEAQRCRTQVTAPGTRQGKE